MRALNSSIWRAFAGLLVAGALSASGCFLIATQFTIEYQIAQVLATTDENISVEEINLIGNEDFEEHKDELAHVDDVMFQLTATNHASTGCYARIYVSEGSLPLDFEEIQTGGLLVLETPELGPSESLFIPFDESRPYIHHLEEFKSLVLTGHFFAYALADSVPFDLELTDVTLVATLTYAE